jgi:hypothetical protein
MDLSEQQGGLDAADKYDKLLQQERELTDFIENFDPNRAGAGVYHRPLLSST